MTTTNRDTGMAREHLAEAREHYAAFRASMRVLGREVRRLDEWQYQRVDAYPGWEGTRDVGAGGDMTGWLDDIEQFLDCQDSGCDGFVGEDAWGACARCGRPLEDHELRGSDAGQGTELVMEARARDIARARAMRAEGRSLYEIAVATGRSKEWLRTYAGMG